MILAEEHIFNEHVKEASTYTNVKKILFYVVRWNTNYDDVITYEDVDLDECKVRLMDISSQIEVVHRSINEMKRTIPSIRDYTFKKNLNKWIWRTYDNHCRHYYVYSDIFLR